MCIYFAQKTALVFNGLVFDRNSSTYCTRPIAGTSALKSSSFFAHSINFVPSILAPSGRMRKFSGPIGSVSWVTIESQALKSNMLGDPSARVVDVYVPAGHDGQGLPPAGEVNLVGFTSSGLSQTNWAGFRENLPELPRPADRRTAHTPRCRRFFRLLHSARRQSSTRHLVTA
jgi:hypothetical protein